MCDNSILLAPFSLFWLSMSASSPSAQNLSISLPLRRHLAAGQTLSVLVRSERPRALTWSKGPDQTEPDFPGWPRDPDGRPAPLWLLAGDGPAGLSHALTAFNIASASLPPMDMSFEIASSTDAASALICGLSPLPKPAPAAFRPAKKARSARRSAPLRPSLGQLRSPRALSSASANDRHFVRLFFAALRDMGFWIERAWPSPGAPARAPWPQFPVWSEPDGLEAFCRYAQARAQALDLETAARICAPLSGPNGPPLASPAQGRPILRI